ncbi:leucine-rich repeat and calponin homology domain-containing protein isoform X2 [Neocloeon triangulifer]|uniref:leucine-rich repeat and calponin homology domain-containing protein isoform X2 n=1 Tax=Neocloeon triangulifer TaxID=2078957 RepID=UPI00286F044B|nr:leucine-rich repeat and calponin homology domain-containing protein isoform X2 [Neocloeon triangulifer]
MASAMVHNPRTWAANKINVPVERILDEAQGTGDLNLSGRRLKEFPRSRKDFALGDTLNADLSKNRFSEVPAEICQFSCLERLDLYHNVLRSVPDNIQYLRSLIYLDLSRNQLQWLPPGICQLASLQVLLLSNNRLARLPSDLGCLSELAELDVAANQLTMLPPSIGKLSRLRHLNARRNHLTQLPVEVAALRLEKLDLTANQISTLPVELRVMDSLVELDLDHNPLVSPPSSLCARGKVHIFKYLEGISQRGDGRRRHAETLDGRGQGRRRQTLPGRVSKTPEPEIFYGHNGTSSTMNGTLLAATLGSLGMTNGSSGHSTPSTLSPGDSGCLLDENIMNSNQELAKRPDRLAGLVDNQHNLTPREFKEQMRMQRMQAQEVYRKGPDTTPPTPPTERHSPKTTPSKESGEKKLDPKMEAVISYVKSQMPNGHNQVENNNHRRKKPDGVNKLSPTRSLSFTMRRENEKAKEEALLLAQLKQNLETRLKMSLQTQELGDALQDGIVLCHLANHVRPRAVASVHVPSPGMPKLPMARCRKNVENFLEACRRIGVPEASVDQLSQALAQSEWVLDRRTCPRLAEVVHHLLEVADQNHNKYRGNGNGLGLIYEEVEETITDITEFDLVDSYEDESFDIERACSSQLASILLSATFIAGLVLTYFLPQEESLLF